MKKRLKIVISIFLTLVCIIALSACGKTQKEENSQNQGSSTSDSSNKAVNPLTGLEIAQDYTNKRPIAVMINNIKQAQPLLGVSQADIMYECPVEGGITRIMAVFKDPRNVDVIGSVRSARPYFITLARGLDAVYMHIGGSSEADAILKGTNIDHFNLGNYSNMMWRDSKRRATMAYEHTAVTSGEKLINGITNTNTRYDLKSGYTYNNKFGEDSPILKADGTKDAKSLKVTFSSYKSTNFDYDETNKTYLVSQFDKPQMDDNAKVQNSKTNVFVLKVNTYDINSKGLKGMDLVGSGTGYYMSNGRIMDIKWSKQSEDSPIIYKTVSGEQLTVLPGQSYVCCIPLNESINVLA